MKRIPTSLWLVIVTTIFCIVWSYSGTKEVDVWLFELLPGTIGVTGLVVLSKRFTFSTMAHLMIAVCFILIATGARYTYAEMPLFNWIRDQFALSRNHFDRFGHFFQGLMIGLMAREVLFRKTKVGRRWGLPILSVSFSLAFSAFYELLEWWVVIVFYPDAGPEWLGLQGDPWDAHWDMSMALAGAMVAVLLLPRLHNRSINDRIQSEPAQSTVRP